MALNIFGDAPQSLTGLLGEQATEDLRKKALTTGLINAAIGYIAQPKTGGYGSALPYLGRALMAGQQGAQGVYEGAITDWERQQKIAEFKRKQEMQKAQDAFRSRIGQPNAERQIVSQSTVQEPVMPMADATAPTFRTQMPAPTVTTERYFDPDVMMNEALQSGALPFEKYLELSAKQKTDSPFAKIDRKDYTSESFNKYLQTKNIGDLEPIKTSGNAPTSAQEYELAQKDPQFYNFLKNKWTAQAQAQAPYRETQQSKTEADIEYNYPPPPSAKTTSKPIPKTATMKDVADTAKASGKTTKQVIDDLKARGINVQGAK
jgi:hypothetical protein